MQMLEKIATYNYTIHYVPERMNRVADGLSRFPVEDPEEEDEEIGKANVRRVFLGDTDTEIFPKNVVDMAELEDLKYQKLVDFFEGERSWKQAEPDVKSYKSVEQDVSIERIGNGRLLILDGTRIIPPHTEMQKLIVKLHVTHKSGDMVIRTAQSLYFWPGMRNSIKMHVDSCEECKVHQRVASKKLTNKVKKTSREWSPWIVSLQIYFIKEVRLMLW